MELEGLDTSCAFTGHRPEKLPWGYDESDPRCRRLKEDISNAVEAVYRSGVRRFVCGMARGCDMYFAEAVITLRDEFRGIILEAAIPCEGQSRSWSPEQRRRYDYILHQCDRVTLVSREYTPDCMQKRNRYMVDTSSVLIAVFGGGPDSKGGTAQTVRYAARLGLEIIELAIPQEGE